MFKTAWEEMESFKQEGAMLALICVIGRPLWPAAERTGRRWLRREAFPWYGREIPEAQTKEVDSPKIYLEDVLAREKGGRKLPWWNVVPICGNFIQR